MYETFENGHEAYHQRGIFSTRKHSMGHLQLRLTLVKSMVKSMELRLNPIVNTPWASCVQCEWIVSSLHSFTAIVQWRKKAQRKATSFWSLDLYHTEFPCRREVIAECAPPLHFNVDLPNRWKQSRKLLPFSNMNTKRSASHRSTAILEDRNLGDQSCHRRGRRRSS